MTAQFTVDGVTSVDLKIVDKDTTVMIDGKLVTVTVQTMQLCTNLGVCSQVYEASGVPTNATLMKEGMDNRTADSECRAQPSDYDTNQCEEE